MSIVQKRMDHMKKKKGQALVEIALALPILLLLLCGIVDFGRILYAGVTLNMVSQEAVRKAGLGKNYDDIIDNCPLVDNGTIREQKTFKDGNSNSGSYVTVALEYDVTYITPFMNDIIPSPFTIRTRSTIRIE